METKCVWCGREFYDSGCNVNEISTGFFSSKPGHCSRRCHFEDTGEKV